MAVAGAFVDELGVTEALTFVGAVLEAVGGTLFDDAETSGSAAISSDDRQAVRNRMIGHMRQ